VYKDKKNDSGEIRNREDRPNEVEVKVPTVQQ